MTLNDKNELLGEVLISAIKKPIYQAADKILNLAIYQLGSEGVDAYKGKIHDICHGFRVSSFSDPLIHSVRFHEILPTLIIEKDKIISILIYDILKPNIESCQPSRILGFIEEIKDGKGIKLYFEKLYKEEIKNLDTFDNIFEDNEPRFQDTSFNEDFFIAYLLSFDDLWIPNKVKKWLISEDVANIAVNIDSTRYDHVASNDLCDALGLLHIKNDYINCEVREL